MKGLFLLSIFFVSTCANAQIRTTTSGVGSGAEITEVVTNPNMPLSDFKQIAPGQMVLLPEKKECVINPFSVSHEYEWMKVMLQIPGSVQEKKALEKKKERRIKKEAKAY